MKYENAYVVVVGYCSFIAVMYLFYSG
jgi:hypothetical protein